MRARGSSPRVRGPQLPSDSSEGRSGLIPAGAGTTCCRASPRPPERAHPRGCGDHLPGRAQRIHRSGSSPRVRGPREVLHRHPAQRGLIPAGAGTTPVLAGWRRCSRAHPRGCGDHVHGVGLGDLHQGLIPAGAGTTVVLSPVFMPDRAHPRGCGDHGVSLYENFCRTGSSPRVRGPQRKAAPQGAATGLIPAGAGTTADAGRDG